MVSIEPASEYTSLHRAASFSAEALRLFLQYGALPTIVYLGYRRGTEFNGERVPLSFMQLLWA